ncbi:MAG TPA: serine/threonine-protein kinase [Gemmatimonadales bacterium]|nr:serine/threonine-protein kinase [Gemmatimonadales bacterium]
MEQTSLDIPPDLQAALADRYTLRRILGRGGMATVYLADDKKHHRAVALKVLLPGLAAYLGVERFLKEIQIAARLTHPHILALHDSGEAGGFLYYVMPYIEGASLRQQLEARDERRLSQHEVFAIAEPVADALAYAHRMGVLHRDIKPENILFSQGHPIVGDFGIAKAVSTAGGANLTRTGFPIGTPGYMSPEQAAGLMELDERTDVYSLAVVVYEMLVGEVPGRWPTEDAVRAGRFLEATPRHRTRLTSVGSRIEAALVRGLAIRHDQRTATPGSLMDELIRGVSAPRRRYDENEVQEIVKRATELEATNKTASGAMTIGGVQALGEEVGVAPELVRAAAESLRRPTTAPTAGPANKVNPWISGPTRLMFERIVDGELPESEYETLVDEIRQMLQDAGQVSQFGRSFTWAMVRGGPNTGVRRNLEITVSIRAGRTRITVHENLAQVIGGVFGGIGGEMGGGGMGPVLGIFAGALELELAAIAVVPIWLGLTYATARYVYRRMTRKKAAELTALVDRLAEVTAGLVVFPQKLNP